MTCKEKLIADHPEWTADQIYYFVHESHCPSDFGYLDDPEGGCDFMTCNVCWNREIPETTEVKKENEEMKVCVSTCEEKTRLIEELKNTRERLAEMTECYSESLKERDEFKATNEDLADKLAEERVNIEILQKAVNTRDEDMVKMAAAHEIDVDTIIMLRARIEELETQIKNLRAEKDARAAGKAKALDEAETKIENLQTKFRSVLRQLDNATRNYDNLLDKNRKLREAYADLERCNNTQAESLKDLLESNDKFKEDIESRNREIAKLVNENQSIQRTLEKYTMWNRTQAESIKAKDKRISELCDRLDKANMERYIENDIAVTKEIAEKIKPINELPYARYAGHIRMKYKALVDNGFSHDDAMGLIPMWDDTELMNFKHDGFRAAVTFIDEMHEYKEN